MKHWNIDDYRLCYVDGAAYFTTQSLTEQWGDDWDDAPYEHNAGRPYEWDERRGVPEWDVLRIEFEGDYETPDSYAHNSAYSVETINRRVVPWVQGDRYGSLAGRVQLWAGVSLTEFCRAILESGGEVYLPMGRPPIWQALLMTPA